MSVVRPAAFALLVLAATASCAGTADDTDTEGDTAAAEGADVGVGVDEDGESADRDRIEQDFLSELGDRRVAVDPAESETVIEVGYGICSGLDSGAPAQDFDSWLEPVTQSIAARSNTLSTDEVASVLIDVSDEILC